MHILHTADSSGGAAPERLMDDEKKARVALVWRHMFMNLIVLVSPVQSRLQYVVNAAGGDTKKAAAWMSYWSASAAFLEFILNPMLGRLSDRYGRKVFLMLSPLVNFMLKISVFLTDGRYLPLVAVDRILGGAITTVGGSTTCAAAISDMLKGPELTGAMGNLGSYAGLGVLVGPFVSGQILVLSGQVKYTYLWGASMAAFQLCYNGICFRETLETAKPMDWGACSPLSFLKIFKGDRTVSRLALVAGLQCFPEGKSLSDLNLVHCRTYLNYSVQMQTFSIMAFGTSMIVAGRLPRILTPAYFSQRNFTSASNYLTILALTVWGTTSTIWQYWLGLGLLCPSMERRAASSAMATDLAVVSGFGRGEFAGCFANWRALCVALAPLIYGVVYRNFNTAGGGGGRSYLTAALITFGTELLFRSIPAEKLDVLKAFAVKEARELFQQVKGKEEGAVLTRSEVRAFLHAQPEEKARLQRGKSGQAFVAELEADPSDDGKSWSEAEWITWYATNFKQ